MQSQGMGNVFEPLVLTSRMVPKQTQMHHGVMFVKEK